MSFEASSRVEDPVYGSVGIISQLQEQIIKAESELAKTKSEIAFHNAQQQLQQYQNEGSSCKIEELHDTDEATTIPTVKPVSSKKSKWKRMLFMLCKLAFNPRNARDHFTY